jgi:hypothetical protein
VSATRPWTAVLSWEVTAARDDQWARKNPLRVEPLKSKADQGKLLQPNAYGERRSKGIMALPTRQPRKLARKPGDLPSRLRRGLTR